MTQTAAIWAEIAAAGPWALAACGAAAFIGTLMQRLAGQGFGMITAPIVAIAAPEFLPATLLLLGAAIGLSSTAVDLSEIDGRELPAGFAGRALGAVIAAIIAAQLTNPDAFAALVAVMIYLGIALSLVGIRAAIRPVSLFLAGTLAGIMGTLTAVGAPPMALLYQYEQQKRAAAMQNAFFLWGMLVSIGALWIAGLVGWRHVGFAVFLAPMVIIGLVVAQPLSRRVAKAQMRPWALGLAGLAATGIVAKLIF
ncbi:MAG: TSUP family transporter [Alphaproteobacteria bacterium]|nr:TSUP family transporter [Alphaproteobacteria bacterium]